MVMTKQTTFTDIEYGNRKRKTKREAFLECMDEIIPWDKVRIPENALPRTEQA